MLSTELDEVFRPLIVFFSIRKAKGSSVAAVRAFALLIVQIFQDLWKAHCQVSGRG